MKEVLQYPSRKFFQAFGLFWGSWCLLQSLILHEQGLSWKNASTDAVMFVVLLALGSLMALTLFRFYQPGSQNRVYRFVFALGISGLCVFLFGEIMPYLIKEDADYLHFIQTSFSLRFVFAFLVISGLSILSWMLHLVKDQESRSRQKNEAEQLLKEAELIRIRQQLQPHFLFNSLNSISALVKSRPDEARQMIQKLSEFLRGTLRKEEQRSVALEEELRQLQLYLEIEKYRFGDRLRVEFSGTETSKEIKIPPLLLQPLLENAIKFGLYGTTGEVHIQIKLSFEAGLLQVMISNPFDPDTVAADKGTGFGLSSVQRRLFLLFARQDLLSTEIKQDVFFTHLKIPQEIV